MAPKEGVAPSIRAGGAILGAEVVGAYKPTPQSYLWTAELLSLQPHEVCMSAAHNNDLHAARACGLRTAFIHRRTEYGLQQQTDRKRSINPILSAVEGDC